MNFFLKRVLTTIPVIFGVITITFFLIHMIPGDPVDMILGEQTQQVDKDILRKSLGLDQPLGKQYFSFMGKFFSGDLGFSIHKKTPVLFLIKEQLPSTIRLALASLIFSLLVGIPLGVFAAIKQYSIWDNSILMLSLAGLSMPAFWLGPVLIYIFSIQFEVLPFGDDESFSSLILPALTLSTGMISILMRMTRTSMLEVINEDYIRTARAKGANYFKIYFRHALFNALVPVLTIVGLLTGALLTGTVIIETVFNRPGLGTLLYQGISERDYPVVQGCVLFISIVYVLVNLFTDLAYAFFRPEIRAKI